MANIRKHGNKYQVQIFKTINGNRVRESKTFLTKADAQKWATVREAELMESDRKGLICQLLLKSAPRLLCKSAPSKNDV